MGQHSKLSKIMLSLLKKIGGRSLFIKTLVIIIVIASVPLFYNLFFYHSKTITKCDNEAKIFAEEKKTSSIEYYKVKYDLAYKLCMRKSGFDE